MKHFSNQPLSSSIRRVPFSNPSLQQQPVVVEHANLPNVPYDVDGTPSYTPSFYAISAERSAKYFDLYHKKSENQMMRKMNKLWEKKANTTYTCEPKYSLSSKIDSLWFWTPQPDGHIFHTNRSQVHHCSSIYSKKDSKQKDSKKIQKSRIKTKRDFKTLRGHSHKTWQSSKSIFSVIFQITFLFSKFLYNKK